MKAPSWPWVKASTLSFCNAPTLTEPSWHASHFAHCVPGWECTQRSEKWLKHFRFPKGPILHIGKFSKSIYWTGETKKEKANSSAWKLILGTTYMSPQGAVRWGKMTWSESEIAIGDRILSNDLTSFITQLVKKSSVNEGDTRDAGSIPV